MSAAPTPPLPTSPDAPPEAWAQALSVDVAALAAPEPDVTAEEQRTVEAIRAHFEVARPGPAAFPSIAMQILELVRYPDVDLGELSKYIRVDGALAGGVLALANSAVYRAVRRIDTVKEAVARLGMSEVARLAAAISMKSLYSPESGGNQKAYEPIWTELFMHAATVARCAADLAKQKLAANPGAEQVFMAGLLHDVGKGVGMRSVSELTEYGKLRTLPAAEVRRALHLVHVELGTEMHRIWQLPPTLADVAAGHHQATKDPFVQLVRMISAADLLRREPGTHPTAPAEVVDAAKAIGLGPARVQALGNDLDQAEAWVKTVFK
ncbi:MAG: HDOD domain-containing protein [Anaeromyxobacteraceae bacterium]